MAILEKKRVRRKQPSVVVVGGGTGTSQLLRGLKQYPISLQAIVTTADTGGSSGVLREEIGMSPPGDVRQCFVALNETSHPFLNFFNGRFSEGSLKGHPFGNLFFALLWQKYRDFPRSVREAEQMVNATHKVIPVTHTPTNLVAYLEDGRVVESEANIIQVPELYKRVRNLEIEPKGVRVNREARQALDNADFIILGPGNVVASLTPPLLISSIADGMRESPAKKVLIVNLMNQRNITGDFEVEDYLVYFDHILGMNVFDTVVYNSAQISESRLEKLGVKDKIVHAMCFREGIRYISRSLVSSKNVHIEKGDILDRTLIKHDEKKIARVIYEQIIKKQNRFRRTKSTKNS